MLKKNLQVLTIAWLWTREAGDHEAIVGVMALHQMRSETQAS